VGGVGGGRWEVGGGRWEMDVNGLMDRYKT